MPDKRIKLIKVNTVFMPFMNAPEFVKKYIRRKILNSAISDKERKKEAINLDKAKSIGIVYILDKDEIYLAVSEFVERLQRKGKRVKAIGFVKDKYLTKNYLPRLTYDFFYDKDINWYGKPCTAYVDEFLKLKFDIIIDLSLTNSYPVEYIMRKSVSRFKIGDLDYENKGFLDLFIKTDEKTSLKVFINEIEYYLSVINKK